MQFRHAWECESQVDGQTTELVTYCTCVASFSKAVTHLERAALLAVFVKHEHNDSIHPLLLTCTISLKTDNAYLNSDISQEYMSTHRYIQILYIKSYDLTLF